MERQSEIVAFALSLARRSVLRQELPSDHPVLQAEDNIYEMSRARLRDSILCKNPESLSKVHRDIQEIARTTVSAFTHGEKVLNIEENALSDVDSFLPSELQ